MDRIFVHLPGTEGSSLINLLQIARVDNLTEDEIVLHMSDGNSVTVQGAEAANALLAFLCDYALTPEGRPMRLVAEPLPAASEAKQTES